MFSFTITQNDKSLDDEMIGEFTGRFRISQGKRIEYIYQNNQIIFTRYYSESQHDEGIRHT